MDKKVLYGVVKEKLTDKRFVHTLGVIETAKELATLYKVDVGRVEIAALFHDYAKSLDIDTQKQILLREENPDIFLLYNEEIWHGPVAACLLKEEYGVEDEDILNAIRFHTIGRRGMSLLEKIIYVSDAIEPNRLYEGVDILRELAFMDINRAVYEVGLQSIRYLERKDILIHPYQFELIDELKHQIEGEVS